MTEIESRNALIKLFPPEYDSDKFEIETGEFNYELMLSEKGREGKYKLVYR